MQILTRRTALKTIVAVCGCSAGVARATGPQTVDQITDVGAAAASGLFRFEPDFLRVAPGEEIAILNSRGDHTVHSAPPLWPEAAPPVGVSHTREARVAFPVEGLYGFRCRLHGQYGMVMLVVCGAGDDLASARARVDAMRARAREKRAFRSLLDRYAAARGD